MNNFWDNRYSSEEFVFGKNPNVFFKSVIDTLTPGNILIPAAGEGRDAVYAATLGWNVSAFDQSIVGKQKAQNYAKEKNVSIAYDVMDAMEYDYNKGAFDVIALIYFHLPPDVRSQFHAQAKKSLAKNGLIILEAFNPKQLLNSSGGPSDTSLLMTADSVRKEFSGLYPIELSEQQIILAEGNGHVGKADVVRFIGKNIG